MQLKDHGSNVSDPLVSEKLLLNDRKRNFLLNIHVVYRNIFNSTISTKIFVSYETDRVFFRPLLYHSSRVFPFFGNPLMKFSSDVFSSCDLYYRTQLVKISGPLRVPKGKSVFKRRSIIHPFFSNVFYYCR